MRNGACIMKRLVSLIIILFALLLGVSGCAEKTVEGIVVSVPASIPLTALTSGKPIGKINFTGQYMKVKLKNGDVVDALATEDQMSEAFSGKGKVTLKRSENDEWMVMSLEEKG